MKTEAKSAEVRLNDEKRRSVHVGDLIEFTLLDGQDEPIIVEVIDLQCFNSFRDMYETISSDKLDAKGQTVDQMIKSTYDIYTPNQEKEWGTLAIFVKIVTEIDK